jgi:hypothetical protein
MSTSATVLSGSTTGPPIPIRANGTSAMCSREYRADARQARREYRFPAIGDPSQ